MLSTIGSWALMVWLLGGTAFIIHRFVGDE